MLRGFLFPRESVITDGAAEIPVRPSRYHPAMRTTLDIDDAVLATVKEIARARGQTIGMVISELARKALESTRHSRHQYRDFPVFAVPVGAEVLTVECVKAIVDDEGLSARR